MTPKTIPLLTVELLDDDSGNYVCCLASSALTIETWGVLLADLAHTIVEDLFSRDPPPEFTRAHALKSIAAYCVAELVEPTGNVRQHPNLKLVKSDDADPA